MHRYELQSGLSKEETEREEKASINNFPKINYHREGKYFFKQQYKCLKVPTQPNQPNSPEILLPSLGLVQTQASAV